MAAWLRPRLPDDIRILVSPALRAQETAEALGLDFITLADLAPEATPDTLLAATGWPRHWPSVLVVGHQPTLGEVAARLLRSEKSSFSIKKGALWWFSCRHAVPDDILLRAVMPPDLLD